MKCPYCSSQTNKVIDSRLSKDAVSIRRRRECLDCKRRFTTYERVEQADLLVVKKDGRREEFDRNKILSGMIKACEKRPISINTIEKFITDFEKELYDRGEREVESREIGEILIKKLYEIDEVAYVRFASVYRSFKDVNQFMDELEELLKEKSAEKRKSQKKKEQYKSSLPLDISDSDNE